MDNVSETGCPPTIASAAKKTGRAQPGKNEIAWYPMRIAYTQDATTMKLRDFLVGKSIEVFLPVEEKVTVKDGKIRKSLAPMFNSLIFIRQTQAEITRLKQSYRELRPLRYYMRHFLDGPQAEIVHIPELQMEHFMRVASRQDGSVIPLGNKDFSHKEGRRVRVIAGIFKGVEGKVCRVKKDRRVVVSLEGVCSVAISCISPDLLETIPDK